jgi:hypothetical protein
MYAEISEEEQREIDIQLARLDSVLGVRKVNLKTTFLQARDWYLSHSLTLH